MELSDKLFNAMIKANERGSLRIRVLDGEERWKPDKPVPRGWSAENITGFGDEEDTLV